MLSQSLELDASFSWSLGFSPWAGPGFLLAGPGRFEEVQGRPELQNNGLRALAWEAPGAAVALGKLLRQWPRFCGRMELVERGLALSRELPGGNS